MGLCLVSKAARGISGFATYSNVAIVIEGKGHGERRFQVIILRYCWVGMIRLHCAITERPEDSPMGKSLAGKLVAFQDLGQCCQGGS